jgi:transcriptional regulator with GAF, ATPase, and Fis domain
MREISEELIKLGKAIPKADQIFVWKNYYKPDDKIMPYKEQIYEWNKKIKTADCSKITNKLENVIIPPELEAALLKDLTIHDVVKNMTDLYSKSLLEGYNVKVTLMVSIFVAGKLWGCLSLDNCSTEEEFSSEDINIVRNCSKALALLLGLIQYPPIFNYQ